MEKIIFSMVLIVVVEYIYTVIRLRDIEKKIDRLDAKINGLRVNKDGEK